MSLALVLTGTTLSAVSGIPGLLLSRSSPWGERIAATVLVLAAAVGLTGASAAAGDREHPAWPFPWPAAGDSLVGLDALSGFFLVPVFLMGALGAIYGLGYWPQARHRRNGRYLRFFWGLLVAGMAVLVVSRHAMAFLLGWEAMALSAFFLVGTEDHRADARAASLLYVFATHVGTLALFALFALWRSVTGSFELRPASAEVVDLGVMTALFFLALLAFGLKAGVMPFHFWLPSAHASAPTHVSAMLSGVVLKMGIYGLVRFLSLLPAPPPAWGGLILVLGAASGLLGVAFALGQHDLKRLLAYHSVENIGIIWMGLGVALLGRSSGRADWIILGLAGCLLHVWNHSLFKGLLFLSAGSVVHAAGTREIDRLGGLAKTMPWTAATFLVGAVAISGLPGLNGFVSEWMVYLALLRTSAGAASTAVLAAPVLAAIGALALACFVKAYGAVFLGSPRTEAAARGHEAPATMVGPMVALAACCAGIGVAPVVVLPMLEPAIAAAAPELASGAIGLDAAVPLHAIGVLAAALLTLVAILTLPAAARRRRAKQAVTWDCGYAAPTARMQYTASSFAQMIVDLLRPVLRPEVHAPEIRGLHPAAASMRSHVGDAVLDRLLVPASRTTERAFRWFHRFQHGLTQHYVLYVLVTVIVMLSLLFPIDRFFAGLFAR